MFFTVADIQSSPVFRNLYLQSTLLDPNWDEELCAFLNDILRRPVAVARHHINLEASEADVLHALFSNPNHPQTFDTSLLHGAAALGNNSVTRTLTVLGANPNYIVSKVTPLFLAAQDGHEAVAATLIAAKAIPDIADKEGATPLYIAAQNGHATLVSLLLAAGASATLATKSGTTPLFIAAQFGHAPVVALLANKDTFYLAKTNGITPILVAIEFDKADVLYALIAAGIDLEHPHAALDNITALFYASYHGHTDMAHILISNNAKVDQRAGLGATPLFGAAQNGHALIVEALIAAGANPLLENDGHTPQLIAVKQGHHELAHRLREY